MRTVLWLAILACITTCIRGREKCCPDLGCFNVDIPWSSPARPVPEPRCDVDVRIYLFTRSNRNTPHELKMWPKVKRLGSPYDPKKKISVYIHGWGECGLCNLSQTIKNATLQAEDVNMLLVDYSSVSREAYERVVSNIRVVASVLARFLNTLIQRHEARPTDMHIIGHSLGAHTAGYAAREIQNVHRVTGLDPAGALFSDYGEEVRLNKNDANFVDIGHTFANPLIPFGGVGIVYSIGHVDFYFNGGWDQPGCSMEANQEIVQQLTQVQQLGQMPGVVYFFSCPHLRAIYYYAEAVISVKNCTFWGIKREDHSLFTSVSYSKWESELSSCTLDSCSPWGLKTTDYPARGSFDVRTSQAPPFCEQRSELQKRMEGHLGNFKANWIKNAFNFIKKLFKCH